MGRLTNTTATPSTAQTAARPGTSLSPVRTQLRALDSAIARAVPTGLSPQRFQRIVLTELSKNPALERCEPRSVLGAVMTAAQLGLEFGPLGHAYLVPYKNRCTLIVGYRGYIDLARRSGQLRSIVARPVHANDRFEFEYGTSERLVHVPADGDRGPVVRYYGVALLHDGGQVLHVMSRADVDTFRKRSMSARDDKGPWTTDYDAMACKTVIRRMVPWLPLSSEAAQAIETDEQVITWNGAETEVDLDTGEIVDAEIIDDPADPADPPAPPPPAQRARRRSAGSAEPGASEQRPERASDDQVTRLLVGLNELGLRDGADRLAFITAASTAVVDSPRDLDHVAADRVIDAVADVVHGRRMLSHLDGQLTLVPADGVDDDPGSQLTDDAVDEEPEAWT